MFIATNGKLTQRPFANQIKKQAWPKARNTFKSAESGKNEP